MLGKIPTMYFIVCVIFETVNLPVGLAQGNLDPLQPHHRTKRNLGQLIALLVKETNYNFFKMSSYGNWCGRGGDRMGDGSYVDGCDLCCKIHDECYYNARHNYQGCNPLFTMYNYRHGEGQSSEDDISADEREHRRKPSCRSEENSAPSCKEAICQCDVKFTICLKKEPCDPALLSTKSRLWWLPG